MVTKTLNMTKKEMVLAVSLGVFLIVAMVSASNSTAKESSVDAKKVEGIYVADFSDDRVLIGASHNIFVGKVIRQVGNKERRLGPETQFEVEVVSNIKGDLKDVVIVDQLGGYKNGALYVTGDVEVTSADKKQENYLLVPGSTYLLSTRYSEKENWYTLNPYPAASKLISSNSFIGKSQLKALADEDSRVKELKAQYPKEILLPEDVAHKNTPNSYQSQEMEQITAQ